MPRSEFQSGINEFHVNELGEDIPSGGLTEASAWKTPSYAWDQLVEHWDAKSQPCRIKLHGNFTKGMILNGQPQGSVSKGQIQPYVQPYFPLERVQQFMFQGADPEVRSIIKPPHGPSVMCLNSAVAGTSNCYFDHADNDVIPGYQIVAGSSYDSVLMLGEKLGFSPSPGQIQIQIGAGARGFIYAPYDIYGLTGEAPPPPPPPPGGSFEVYANVGSDPNNMFKMGLSRPWDQSPEVQVGATVSGPHLLSETLVAQRLEENSRCFLILSKAAQDDGTHDYTFTNPGGGSGGGGGGGGGGQQPSGPNIAHAWVDPWGILQYEGGEPNGYTPIIEVRCHDTPAFSGAMYVADGGDILLKDDPSRPQTVFKGSVSGTLKQTNVDPANERLGRIYGDIVFELF